MILSVKKTEKSTKKLPNVIKVKTLEGVQHKYHENAKCIQQCISNHVMT